MHASTVTAWSRGIVPLGGLAFPAAPGRSSALLHAPSLVLAHGYFLIFQALVTDIR